MRNLRSNAKEWKKKYKKCKNRPIKEMITKAEERPNFNFHFLHKKEANDFNLGSFISILRLQRKYLFNYGTKYVFKDDW